MTVASRGVKMMTVDEADVESKHVVGYQHDDDESTITRNLENYYVCVNCFQG